MEVILGQLANSLEGKAIMAIAALSVLDFVTGSLRAVQSKQFDVAAFGAWVSSSLIQVVIVALVIVVGKALGPLSFGDVQIDVIGLAGLAAAASFGTSTIQSILDNLNPKVPDKAPKGA